MSNVIGNLVNAARHFTGMDFGVFKISLLSIGILLGAYFSRFFMKYISIVWIVAVAACLLLIILIIRHYKKTKN